MHKILKQILFVSLGLIFSITSSFADGTRILKFGKHLDFGTVAIGNSATRELTLYNNGDSELTISNLTFHKKIRDSFSGNWSGLIPAHGEQNVTITFTPIRNTRVSGLVYVESDRTNSGDRSRSLKGLGEDESSKNTRILRLGKHLDFGDVAIGSSSVKQLTVYNDGNSVLNISKIRFHQKLNDVYTAPWTGSIPAYGSKLIDIIFKPIDKKIYNGLVYIESDKTNNVDRSRLLRGVGIESFENHRPIIHLNGDPIVTISKGSSYVDAGAVANDVEDGNITANIVIVNSVDTSTVGDYSVIYDVNDSSGNLADTKIRTIHVVLASDTTKPIITLLGDVNISVIKGTTYTDAGATASDNIDGDISSEIAIDNPVDTDAEIGTKFVVTYSVFDNAGNSETVTRNITIVRDLDISLTDWIANGDGTWVLQSDYKSVKQTRNGNPTIYHNNVNSQSNLFKLSGQITVQTRTDDDFIGFVLGYHDGDINKDDVDYLLIDWKQGNQPDAIGDATRGLAISRVTKKLGNTAGAWIHSSEDGVTELQRATTFGHARWADNTTYTFEITFTETLVEVFIDGVKELSISGIFNNGAYGFYNYSQANVLYSAIEVSTDSGN